MPCLALWADWILHIPKADDSHGPATVAPADTMLHEGTYDDFEILGDIRPSDKVKIITLVF